MAGVLSFQDLKDVETSALEAIRAGTLYIGVADEIEPLSSDDAKRRYNTSERGKISTLRYRRSDKYQDVKRRELDKRIIDRNMLKDIQIAMLEGKCACLSDTKHPEHAEVYNLFITAFRLKLPSMTIISSNGANPDQ